jgi:2-iminobutanoate/2-iminopropanoate deaminase
MANQILGRKMTMKKQTIEVPMVKSPLHAQAIRVGDLVFTAGQLSIDPATGKPISGNIKVQTRQALENLKLVLSAAGTSLDNAVKATVYLRTLDDFDDFNNVYLNYFPKDPPCRTTTQAGRLGGDFLIEIEVVAAMP